MKKVLFIIVFVGIVSPIFADVASFVMSPVPRRLDTKEDMISLDVQTMNQNMKQDIIARNIYFLELAVALPFNDPIKALIRITNEQQYQKYQYAVMAHIYRRLADEYKQYGQLFYKRNLYFFNTEYLKEYIEGYDIAEFYYKAAYLYRAKAVQEAKKARAIMGELNPNWDQSLIDWDEMIYYLTDDPLDYIDIYRKIFRELNSNRDKAKELLAQQNATNP